MKNSVLTMGVVPAVLVNPKYGKLPQRVKAAGETLGNNAVLAAKTAGIAGASAVAIDTFAGNQAILNGIKTKFPSAAQVATKAGSFIKKGISTFTQNEIVKKGIEKFSKTNLANNIKDVIAAAKKNPKVAIAITAATAAGISLIKWAHNQGRIDEKYQSAAQEIANGKND